MADDDRDKDAPSLEPPSFFRRKKDKQPTPRTASQPAPPVSPPPVSPPPVSPPPTRPVARPPAPPATRPPAPPTSQPAAPPPPGPPAMATEPEPTVPAKPPRQGLPSWVTGPVAAALTGLVVGALIVAATAASLRLCSAVKGTSSCGGPGLFLLLAILTVAVLVGATLLRLARVAEPGSTSFLAVGLVSVVALLFLVDQLFEWWMFIAIPLVSAATYFGSSWVTTNYIEPTTRPELPDATRPADTYDVR